MARTPKNRGTPNAASSSFLQQLDTLRGFVTAMGMKHTEAQMSTALRSAGYNVELALERLLGGDDASGGTSSASMSTFANNTGASVKKRKNETPAKSIKRTKSSPKTPATPHHSTAAASRLLLCKRWTVSCSKTIRGRISYGEKCNFDENYKSATASATTSAQKADPMVRFRTRYAEGTLNRYLCEILGPLLRLPATNISYNAHAAAGSYAKEASVPMIHLEAEALMEDNSLIIGSDIPINLKIYLNDPVGFFDLFQQDVGKSESSQFFGRKNTSRKGKRYEVAEAAFRLLQWAEKGEEIDYGIEEKGVQVVDISEMNERKSDKSEDDASSTSSATQELVLDTADGDYEVLESQEVNELNEIMVADAKNPSESIPELSDPSGFKDDVVLRPYQRQALYWMCRREGLTLKQLNIDGKEEYAGDDEELELLAELAASTHSSRESDDVQVWGGSGIACDCGPVVVGDDEVASRAVPVIDYGQNVEQGRKYVHHPLWKRRFLASDDLTTVYAFYVNELLGIAAASPPNPPKQCVGGILADAMGLGKTVMLMSLILQSRAIEIGDFNSTHSSDATTDVEVLDVSSDDEDDKDEDYIDKEEAKPKMLSNNTPSQSCGTTLVVAPLSLISQWEEEMATKTNLTSLVYYDSSSKKLTGGHCFSTVDVVVTTYGTIQSEYTSLSRASKNGGSWDPGANQPLLSFGWKRIILDEAHGIKNPTTIVSKACCLLRSESRWCVTGTPIQNSLQDVYGLLKFLRHEPWCESSFWKNAITSAISDDANGKVMVDGKLTGSPMKRIGAPEPMSVAFERVRRVLAPIILRRTKDTIGQDGKPILTLPPIENKIISVKMTEPESSFYNALLKKSQSVFDGYIKAGTASKSWFAIFSLLQRLRQSCDHVSLTVQNRFDTSEIGEDDSQIDASASSQEGSVSDKFLADLLSKFKKTMESTQSNSNSFVQEVAVGLRQSLESNNEYLNAECPVCLEEPKITDAVHTPCAHMFCMKCLIDEFCEQLTRCKKQSDTKRSKIDGGDCPVCNTSVKLSQVIQIKKSDKGEMISTYINEAQLEKENVCVLGQKRDEVARETLELALMRGATSSKLDAIINELDEIWKVDPGSKVLVFSQFLGFLDIITRALNRRNITSYRLDGKTSLKDRVKMIDKFNRNDHQTRDFEDGTIQRGSVFLVSMKAGGCGLNLVAASSVFIVDPWWNMAIEDQCINRIHRIGQKAECVRVRKFVVEDSVEQKIVKLQMKKKNMATDILDSSDGSGMESSKPTLDDFKLIFGS